MKLSSGEFDLSDSPTAKTLFRNAFLSKVEERAPEVGLDLHTTAQQTFNNAGVDWRLAESSLKKRSVFCEIVGVRLGVSSQLLQMPDDALTNGPINFHLVSYARI